MRKRIPKGASPYWESIAGDLWPHEEPRAFFEVRLERSSGDYTGRAFVTSHRLLWYGFPVVHEDSSVAHPGSEILEHRYLSVLAKGKTPYWLELQLAVPYERRATLVLRPAKDKLLSYVPGFLHVQKELIRAIMAWDTVRAKEKSEAAAQLRQRLDRLMQPGERYVAGCYLISLSPQRIVRFGTASLTNQRLMWFDGKSIRAFDLHTVEVWKDESTGSGEFKLSATVQENTGGLIHHLGTFAPPAGARAECEGFFRLLKAASSRLQGEQEPEPDDASWQDADDR